MTDQGPPAPPPAQPSPGFPAPVPPQPGFAAPYAPPGVTGYAPPAPTVHGSRTLGAVAFILSLGASLLVPLVASFAAWRIGTGVGAQALAALLESSDPERALLTALSPVRGAELMAEVAFWAGTVLGIWAIVQGIIAIVRARGRGFGIAAIVIAVIGPILYVTLVSLLLGLGAAASIPANA